MPYRRKVLVAEDNALNRQILCAILEDTYCVIQAENGQVALELLRHNKDSISLVLLDVVMPVMDGYAFLNQVREDPELSTIPIIVMTQGNSEEDELNALNQGATDFVPKPYRPQVILNRAAALIKLRENASMVSQLKYDRLTHRYSREYFYEKVRNTLREDYESEYAVVCTNIENFKLINDAYGSLEGDHVLKATAKALKHYVGSDGFCGRFNADRFLCLIRREKTLQDGVWKCRDIFFNCSDRVKNIVVRFGIYMIADASVPVEQMCDRALMAVDSIKNRYDCYYAIYDDDLMQKLLRRQALTSAMEMALREEQFQVYLQPRYSLRGNALVGAEALARWIHPELGMISPIEFIPLFERNGFIPRLDSYIWELACRTMGRWKRQGEFFIPISVNISRADLLQPEMLDVLVNLLKKYDLSPAELRLEITESAYVDNQKEVVEAVELLRKNGFPVEMDDFGSGYSSLNMLSQMSLDTLKLDMKFIQSEIAKPAERSLLAGVIDMAHWAQLDVVAEGVETREQLNRLREVGCDYAQGYLFSEPMPLERFEQLAKEHRPCSIGASLKESGEFNSKSLLIVDENDEFRRKICERFTETYSVFGLGSAEEMMQLLEKSDKMAFGAVILSLTLPEQDIKMIWEAIRKTPALTGVPVLAMLPAGGCRDKIPEEVETDDFLCKCHPVEDIYRRVRRLIDIENFRKRAYLFQEEARRDPLTGVLNRRGLDAAIASVGAADAPLAVCMFDLDGMKLVNDTYGHSQGDRMIRAFTELLMGIVNPEDIKCRYGGDEFLLILKKIPSADAAVQKVDSICTAFRSCIGGDGHGYSCTAGVSLCSQSETLSLEHIDRADQALYCAKNEKKGGCVLWHSGMEFPRDGAE